MEIIGVLKEPINKGLEARVNWCYADDDILEARQIYESITKVPFKLTIMD